MFILMLAGAAVAALGLLFHMQGRGVVGPEQSFMYSSPDWLQYGIWIAAAGVVMVGAGLLLRRRRS
jgi:MYXO-CTERM domain-containing protein